jgi:3-hydroxyacyl-[acyl-carrier-protein] dehydratase
MRFLLYDKITTLAKGESITGIKSFTLSEECFRGHFNKKALVPGVLFIETMAQLLGWLIIYSHDFRLSPFMSLIEDVRIPHNLRPDFSAEIHARLLSTSTTDSLGSAQMVVNGELIASIGRIIYSHTRKVNAADLIQLFSYYSGFDKSQFLGDAPVITQIETF